MVQMMDSRSKVKLEAPDCHDFHHLPKRFKLDSSFQGNLDAGDSTSSSSLYNPLDEPSPLGLRLKKTPSFLDLIQMRLTQRNASNSSILKKKDCKGNAVSGATDKLKASNFPVSVLRIGSWEYKSRHEGDLVAKCYFAKHKLVWEMLDQGLKNKIEIQWSDVVAIKASYQDDRQGTLDVVLARQPLFFRETNPQPKKHTLWKATSDFTCGQASTHRRHFLQCSPGLLGKHFEKLIQCDPRLHFLSQQSHILLDSPYFEPRVSIFDGGDESNSVSGLGIGIPAAVLATQTTSSIDEHNFEDRDSENVNTASPSSAMEIHGIQEFGNSGVEQQKQEEKTTVGFHTSMSMSDLINHIGICISEQMTSGNTSPGMDNLQGRDLIGEISQYLLNDSQLESASNEQVMSRVNSLCCLLQKDFAGDLLKETDGESKEPSMSRKDSVGDLLLSLPRIASLPQFLFSISETSENRG